MTRRLNEAMQGMETASDSVQAVPRELQRLLLAMLLIAAVASVPFLGRFGPLPTTELLDAWIILFCVMCFVRGRTLAWVAVLLVLAYGLVSRLVPALYTDAPLQDFAQAYRWLLYLVAFCLAVGRPWINARDLRIATLALLGLALVKSVLTFVLLGPGERPGLLLENNFELPLFAGLLALVFRDLGRLKVPALLALAVLTALSGSRSGAAAFAILAIWAIFQMDARAAFSRFALLCVVPLVTLIPLWVFASRTGSTTIDRLNFFTIFQNETRNWTWFNWLIGTTPITPLSPGACNALRSYDSLFSSSGDGSCYSVILHAFTMRVVFDAGICGLILAFGVTFYALRRAGVAPSLIACLVLIAASNSFSVSGLNNPYVALPILLAICRAAALRSAHPREFDQNAGSTVVIRSRVKPGRDLATPLGSSTV